MAEPQKKKLDLIEDTETLRRLWDEGIASGPFTELDFDAFRKKARESLVKAREQK